MIYCILFCTKMSCTTLARFHGIPKEPYVGYSSMLGGTLVTYYLQNNGIYTVHAYVFDTLTYLIVQSV